MGLPESNGNRPTGVQSVPKAVFLATRFGPGPTVGIWAGVPGSRFFCNGVGMFCPRCFPRPMALGFLDREKSTTLFLLVRKLDSIVCSMQVLNMQQQATGLGGGGGLCTTQNCPARGAMDIGRPQEIKGNIVNCSSSHCVLLFEVSRGGLEGGAFGRVDSGLVCCCVEHVIPVDPRI